MTTYTYAHLRTRGLLETLSERTRPMAKILRAALGRAWGKFAPVAMTTAGLGCITAAMFTWSVMAGLIAAGISFFVVDWVGK